MPQEKPFNLFVYGTLMNPMVFRAVLGRRLVTHKDDADGVESVHAAEAVLDGYKKISPDNTYLYAVPDPHGRIRGYLISNLSAECMAALRRYEGRNYSRRTLSVLTKDGPRKAVLFVGNLKQLEHAFGYAFRDPLKQEILLREKIEAALLEAEREQLHTDETIARRAIAELQGPTIRDLVRRHFEAGGISNYAIRHSIKDAPLRDFARIARDHEAERLAPNYLALVVKQVVFNQFEDKVGRDFRYELDRMRLASAYYDRTVSSLTALRLLNADVKLLDVLVGDALTDLRFQKNRLVDFVQWAIVAADAMYEPARAKRELDLIRSHMGRGYIPLGTELEFSNIGHNVIRDPQGKAVRDPWYDGFLYFGDFGLDALTWKLGGHIDDHHEKAPGRPRRGFFEVALGSLSIEANISKPITDDPWLLNQFIQETMRFYSIRPHSVHVSLQLRSRRHPAQNRLLPLSVMKCLLALGGDPGLDEKCRLRILRLWREEIVRSEAISAEPVKPGEVPASPDPIPHMVFSDVSRRFSSDVEDPHAPAGEEARRGLAGRYVQQFKFLRLAPGLNYEPIVMGLKGIQLSLRPGSFLTPLQYRSSRRHRQRYQQLLAWGHEPKPIPQREVEAFLTHVHQGLMTEKRGRPAHSPAYIAWALSQLRRTLESFNALAARAAATQPSGTR